ncbi:MAG: DUF1501 domain-containing protein [Planctomycetaceae bacterium]
MTNSLVTSLHDSLRISRRAALSVGAPLLGLGLADILRSRSLAEEIDPPRRKQRSLIVFWTHGGMTQQDTYDLKPHAAPEYRGEYSPIDTNVAGLKITEKFPRQAQVMDRLSIVRSVHHGNAIHAPSAHWMQTGYFGPTLARNAPQKPSMGSVIARTCGTPGSQMPPYVAVPQAEAFGYQGAVYLGAAYNPFEVGADPNADGFSVPNLSLPQNVTLGVAQNRAKLLKTFDTLRRDIDSRKVMDGLETFKAKALDMITGEQVREAFDISQEDPALRDRYGRHQYGQSALLARRLVEAGSVCVTVNTGYWDHHDNIFKELENHLSPLDAAIATLVEDLTERGLLNDVLILCAGEFGRTPLINGHAGRDHWSKCFSVLLGGGGLKGGTIVGASESRGGGVLDRPTTPLDILATIYQAMGIPLDTHFEDASGRPISIVDTGKPIRELS